MKLEIEKKKKDTPNSKSHVFPAENYPGLGGEPVDKKYVAFP